MNAIAKRSCTEQFQGEIFGIFGGSTIATCAFIYFSNFYKLGIVACTGIGAYYGYRKVHNDKKDRKRKMVLYGIYGFKNKDNNKNQIKKYAINGFLFGVSLPAIPYMIPAYVAYKFNQKYNNEE